MMTHQRGESTVDCELQDEGYAMESESSQILWQSEFNDFVRDLSLSKESAKLLGSRLEEEKLLLPGIRTSSYRTRESKLLQYFDN